MLQTTQYSDRVTHLFALFQDTAYNLLADGVVLRQGSYLSAVADIGVFEHSLTTDLLNHLVFVQKVFMKVSCWYDVDDDDDDDGWMDGWMDGWVGGGDGDGDGDDDDDDDDATFHLLNFAVYLIFV